MRLYNLRNTLLVSTVDFIRENLELVFMFSSHFPENYMLCSNLRVLQ